jgi:chromosome segregation ATPase
MFLAIVPDDLNSATKAIANLKTELDKEKIAWKAAQIEVDMLTWAIKDLKISADKFAAQIPTLEDKVKHLENKVVDGLNEVRAWELCLECTTWANDDYKKQNTQLINKLESKFPWSLENIGSFLKYFLTNPTLAYKIGCQA